MKIDNLALLVCSCDNYSDIWEPFFKLWNKYSGLDIPVYITTETTDCPYAKTLKFNYPLDKRTGRIRESLKEIPEKYVIVMDEDCFVSDYIDIEEIQRCIERMENNPYIAQFNFEPAHDKTDIISTFEGWLKRDNNNGGYVNSFQPSLHNRSILIERLHEDMDGWAWEGTRPLSDYAYYISKRENRVIKYGKELHPIFGIFRGKWYAPHVVPLFEKEGIEIDFMQRGFID